MLILIMLVFFICWAPILIFNLLAAFSLLGPDNMGTGDTTKHLKTVFSLMAYLNRCCFNIIVALLFIPFQLLKSNHLRIHVEKLPRKFHLKYLYLQGKQKEGATSLITKDDFERNPLPPPLPIVSPKLCSMFGRHYGIIRSFIFPFLSHWRFISKY